MTDQDLGGCDATSDDILHAPDTMCFEIYYLLLTYSPSIISYHH